MRQHPDPDEHNEDLDLSDHEDDQFGCRSTRAPG
jgi:hypothetical protein